MPVKRRGALYFAGTAALLLIFTLSLPEPLFRVYYSPALYDRNGELLGAMVAFDGQWRFPPASGPVNEKFAAALIEAEDRRFREHTGIDFPALARALVQNFQTGHVVSGASTITMQTIRLARNRRNRTVFEKAVEAALALRLELSCSKDEILALYAANAPFGANVVGLEAAAWRWFGRPPEDLSWAEAAALAVLPNGPGLIHPGRNRNLLKEKRDVLLFRLFNRGYLDAETLTLAQSEELPGEPLPLPNLAPHLLARLVTEAGGPGAFIGSSGFSARMVTTLDYQVQERAAAILRRWSGRFAERGIMNGACIILDTESGAVLAYVGNSGLDSGENAPDVDIVTAPRSSGSILKPFLYAAMLDSGDILPGSLVSDIPTRVGSYSPENNSRSYLGVVPAGEALARSLNVPAVRSLRVYGIEPFARLLKGLGLSTLFRPPDDYGLPLILGGAEVTLWDMAGLYAGLARQVMDVPGGADTTAAGAFFPPLLFPKESLDLLSRQRGPEDLRRHRQIPAARRLISRPAAWLTLEALTFVVRPGEEAQWQEYAGSRRIAWKTGTSFGNRDAWALGTTPLWTAGVWIGNASGEGRADLVSVSTSAPVLFELFSALDSMFAAAGKKTGAWFPQPAAELDSLEVCAFSGFPAGPDCSRTKEALVPRDAPRRGPCPYCRTVALNSGGTERIRLEGTSEPIRLEKWFVLPPAEEWYYRRWNLDYKPLPPYRDMVLENNSGPASLALFNPEPGAQIYVPRELDGREGRIVFQAAHREDRAVIYWHLDDSYLGETEVFHEMEARPGPGFHTLTLVDSGGNRITRRFEVLSDAG